MGQEMFWGNATYILSIDIEMGKFYLVCISYVIQGDVFDDDECSVECSNVSSDIG